MYVSASLEYLDEEIVELGGGQSKGGRMTEPYHIMDHEESVWEKLKAFVKEEAVWRGQLVSFLVAMSGVFATFLASLNSPAVFPLFMGFFIYSSVATFILIKYYLNPADEDHRLENLHWSTTRNPWWLYAVGAVLDVEANYCVTLAYKYTSITSIMLLDCFTIPCVMVLSIFFLRARYVRQHFWGSALAVLGLVCIVVSDVQDRGAVDSAMIGDVLVLIGVGLYACSNVLQEAVMKVDSREEYLVMMPGFAALLSAAQSLVLELPWLGRMKWTWETLLCMSGFVVVLHFFYLNVSRLLKDSDSALFNLSLLTSDVYAVVFSFLFTGHWVNWLYLIAFLFVAIGIYIYHSVNAPTTSEAASDALSVPKQSSSGLGSTLSKYDYVEGLDGPRPPRGVEGIQSGSNPMFNPGLTGRRESEIQREVDYIVGTIKESRDLESSSQYSGPRLSELSSLEEAVGRKV